MLDILFACALLASGTTANKILLQHMPVPFFVAIRMLLSGGFLFLGIFKKSEHLRFSYIKQDWVKLLLITCCTTFIPSLFKAYALQHMPLQKASLLASFDPFVAALYGYILCNEQLGFQKLLGMFIGFAGIVLLLFSSSAPENMFEAYGIISWPELAAVGAVFISRYGWILVAQMITQNRYDTYEINSIMMIAGALLSFIMCGYYGCLSFDFLIHLPVSLWAVLLYTVLIGNICGYTLWSSLFKKYTISFMSLTGFSISIFAALYGYLLFSEPLTFYFICSATITFIGLLIFYHKENKNIKK